MSGRFHNNRGGNQNWRRGHGRGFRRGRGWNNKGNFNRRNQNRDMGPNQRDFGSPMRNENWEHVEHFDDNMLERSPGFEREGSPDRFFDNEEGIMMMEDISPEFVGDNFQRQRRTRWNRSRSPEINDERHFQMSPNLPEMGIHEEFSNNEGQFREKSPNIRDLDEWPEERRFSSEERNRRRRSQSPCHDDHRDRRQRDHRGNEDERDERRGRRRDHRRFDDRDDNMRDDQFINRREEALQNKQFVLNPAEGEFLPDDFPNIEMEEFPNREIDRREGSPGHGDDFLSNEQQQHDLSDQDRERFERQGRFERRGKYERRGSFERRGGFEKRSGFERRGHGGFDKMGRGQDHRRFRNDNRNRNDRDRRSTSPRNRRSMSPRNWQRSPQDERQFSPQRPADGEPMMLEQGMASVVQTEDGPMLMGPDGPIEMLPPGIPIMIQPGMEPQVLGPVGPDGMQQVLVQLDQPPMAIPDQIIMEQEMSRNPPDDSQFRSRGRGRGRGRWNDGGRGRGRGFDRGRGRGFDRGRGRGGFHQDRRDNMKDINQEIPVSGPPDMPMMMPRSPERTEQMFIEPGMMPPPGMVPLDVLPPDMPEGGVPVMLDPNTLQPVQLLVHNMEPGMAPGDGPEPLPRHPMDLPPRDMPPRDRLMDRRDFHPERQRDQRTERRHDPPIERRHDQRTDDRRPHRHEGSSDRSSSRSREDRSREDQKGSGMDKNRSSVPPDQRKSQSDQRKSERQHDKNQSGKKTKSSLASKKISNKQRKALLLEQQKVALRRQKKEIKQMKRASKDDTAMITLLKSALDVMKSRIRENDEEHDQPTSSRTQKSASASSISSQTGKHPSGSGPDRRDGSGSRSGSGQRKPHEDERSSNRSRKESETKGSEFKSSGNRNSQPPKPPGTHTDQIHSRDPKTSGSQHPDNKQQTRLPSKPSSESPIKPASVSSSHATGKQDLKSESQDKVPPSTSQSVGKAGLKPTSQTSGKPALLPTPKSTAKGAPNTTSRSGAETSPSTSKGLTPSDKAENQSETAVLIKTLSSKLEEILANKRDNNAEDRDMILLLQSALDAARKRTDDSKTDKSNEKSKSVELKSQEKQQITEKPGETSYENKQSTTQKPGERPSTQTTSQDGSATNNPNKRPRRHLTKQEWAKLKKAAEDAIAESATGVLDMEQAIIREAKKVIVSKDENQTEKTAGSTTGKSGQPGQTTESQQPVKPPPMARFKAEKRKALERKAAKEAAKKARLEEEAQAGKSTSQTPTLPSTQSQTKPSSDAVSTTSSASGPILSTAVQAVKAAEETFNKLAASSEKGSDAATDSATLAAQLKAIETLTEVATKDLPPSLQSVVKEKLSVQQARITAQQLSKQTPPPVSIPGLGELDKTTTTTQQQPAVSTAQIPTLTSSNNQTGVPRGPTTQSGIPMGFRAQLAAGLVRGAQPQAQPPRGQLRALHPTLYRPRGPLLGQARGVQSQPVIQRGPLPGFTAPARLGVTPPQVTGSMPNQQRGVNPPPNLRGPPPALPVMRPPPSVRPTRPLFPITTQVTVAASTFQRPPPQLPVSQTFPIPRGPPPQIPASQGFPTTQGPPPQVPVSQSLDYYLQRTPVSYQTPTSSQHTNIQSKNSTEEATQELDKILSKDNTTKKGLNKKGPQPKLAFNVKKIESPKQIQPVPVSRLVASKEKPPNKLDGKKQEEKEEVKTADILFNKLQKEEEKKASEQKSTGKTAEVKNKMDKNSGASTGGKKDQTGQPKDGISASKARRMERKKRYANIAEARKKDKTATELERDRLLREDHQTRRRKERQKSPVKLVTRCRLPPATDQSRTGSRSPKRLSPGPYSRRSPGRRSPDRSRQKDTSRSRLSPEYNRDRGSSGRISPTRDLNRSRRSPDRYRNSSPGRSSDRSRISSDRVLKSGRSPDRYRNKTPPREQRLTDLHSDVYGSSGRAYRSPDRYESKRSPDRGSGSRYSRDPYDDRDSLSPYSRRSPSPYSNRSQHSQELYISRSPVRYPNIPSSVRLSPRNYDSPPPFRRSRSRSPIRYHDQRRSRSISPDQRSRRATDSRLRRSRSPDLRLRRSQSPVPRSRRSLSPRYRRSPDPRSRRSLSPDGRYRRSPDSRSRRSLSPDHRSRRSRSPRDIFRGHDQQQPGAYSQLGNISLQTPGIGPNLFGSNMPPPNFNPMVNQFIPNIPPPNANPIVNQFGQIVNPGNVGLNQFGNQPGNLGPNQHGSNLPPLNTGPFGNLPLNTGPFGNLQSGAVPFGNPSPVPGPLGIPSSNSGPFGCPPPSSGPFGNQPTSSGPSQLGNPVMGSVQSQFGSQSVGSGPGQMGNQATSSSQSQLVSQRMNSGSSLSSSSSGMQQSSPNQQGKADARLMPPPSVLREQSPTRNTSNKSGNQDSQQSLSQGTTGQTGTNKPPVLRGILKKRSNVPPASESGTASSVWQSLTGVKDMKSDPPTKRFTSGALNTLQESYKEPSGTIPTHIVQKLQEWLPGLGDNLLSGLKNTLSQVKSNDSQLNRNNSSQVPMNQGQQQMPGQQISTSKEMSFSQHRYMSEPKPEIGSVKEKGQEKPQTGMEDTYESFLNVIGYEKKTESTKQSPTPNYTYKARRDTASSSIPGLDISESGGSDGDRFKKSSGYPGLFSSDQASGSMTRPQDSLAGPRSHLGGPSSSSTVSSSASSSYFNAPISFNRPGVFPSAARLNQILRK